MLLPANHLDSTEKTKLKKKCKERIQKCGRTQITEKTLETTVTRVHNVYHIIVHNC